MAMNRATKFCSVILRSISILLSEIMLLVDYAYHSPYVETLYEVAISSVISYFCYVYMIWRYSADTCYLLMPLSSSYLVLFIDCIQLIIYHMSTVHVLILYFKTWLFNG